LSLQDVFVSDKNSFLAFVSPSQSCPEHPLRTSAEDPGVSKTRNSFSLMNSKDRTKGRPRKETDKRLKKIDVRFTEEEFAVITELEKTLGITRTDLVRQRVLANARPVIVNARELIVLLNDIGRELGRSGNNINQLAKYANILTKSDAISPVVIERFNMLFAEYIKNQHSLDRSLRKLMRIAGS
jgi:uncharacterized protein (DUF1778 family)